MPKGTIRSAAHRQILAWLRQGPSTVSEIAEQFEMRMPHASLACRQLRASGLVVRDESGGLRNAPMYLSQSGLDRIRENAVAKLRQHARRIDRKSVACVLQADASDVLIGYVEPLRSPLLFIPASNELNPTSSTGNEGGVWVLLEEEETEWYNLDDFSLALPPSAAQGTTLQD
ncbi:MAG: winged helix-turn-helix transcriptional regulator, partial [Candidatus Poseidonia sp.]|nr:winged helix-turn-helix transcriptional regulator [Poseidonia sp.]